MVATKVIIDRHCNPCSARTGSIPTGVILGIIFSCLMAMGQARAETAELVVRLENIRDTGGQLRISLYRDPDSFRKEEQAFRVTTVAAAPGTAEIVFDGLEAGRYAVMAYHDANGDNRLNLRFGMFPSEGYGLSNNPKVMGPPNFADSAFDLVARSASTTITLSY